MKKIFLLAACSFVFGPAVAAACELNARDYKALAQSESALTPDKAEALAQSSPKDYGMLCETREAISQLMRNLSKPLPEVLASDEENPYLSPGEKLVVEKKKLADEANSKFKK